MLRLVPLAQHGSQPLDKPACMTCLELELEGSNNIVDRESIRAIGRVRPSFYRSLWDRINGTSGTRRFKE